LRTARYRRIAEALQAAIMDGTYRPGARLPTEAELAAAHQVSHVTAAAALNELARAGLVTRTPRRGTVVLGGLSAHRSTRPKLVAWILDYVEPTFQLGLLHGLQRGAQEAGAALVLGASGSTPAEEAQAIQAAVATGAAGIILYLQDGEGYNADVLRLVLGGYPVVLIDRYLRGVHCAVVSSDNVGGARLVVHELLDAGHRQICVLSWPPRNTSTIEDRLRGYVQTLTDAGVPVDFSLHFTPSGCPNPASVGWEPAPEVLDRFVAFLRTHPDVTAIFATNAALGLLALRAVERLRWRIPEDISLVCIDPLEAIPLSVPRVTAAVQDVEAMGLTAVRLLDELIAGKPPRTVLFPMRLERAGTVGPPAPRPSAALLEDALVLDHVPSR
jgi:DNA-binding LacI/PurR family transcriptional regulator